MASHTKVEPIERTPAGAPASGVGASSRAAGAEPPVADRPVPASSIEAAAEGPFGSDDEDVSLDELMMSDSNEGDEPPASTSDDAPATEPAGAAPAEWSNEGERTSNLPLEPFGVDPLDDEAAALAAAAAAQEAAAQAAAEEADARLAAARLASESQAVASRPSVDVDAKPPSVAPSGYADRIAAMIAPPSSAWDLSTENADDVEPSTGQVQAVAAPVVAPPAPPVDLGFDAAEPPDLEQPSDALDAPLPVEASRPEARAVPRSTPPPARGRADAPLPSFDIPEAGARRAAADGAGDDERAGRLDPRPLATPLSHLSEVGEEDDDDAVTHIGLPVVPESFDDYPEVGPTGFAEAGPTGFAVADPGVAALQGFEPDLSLVDARRATTRVVPRLDPAQLQQQIQQQSHRTRDTNPALSIARRAPSVGKWLSGVFRRYRPQAAPPAPSSPSRRQQRPGWLLDTLLPPLSLVLFGSGIGAGIMLLLQPDRGARAAQTVQSLKEAPDKKPVTLAERAEAGEGDALFKLTNMSPSERTSALTLALERGYQTQRQNEFQEFAKSLDAPSGLATPNLTNRFLNFVTSPETTVAAFADLLTWPGTVGPDVLYAVWEKAPGGSRAASLAQQLLHAEDQRAKATPALLTALDLRSATTCDDYLRIMPAVQRDGDQRCSATLRALKHRDGCGDDGQQDCFACLREGPVLDDALRAIEGRIPPQL